MKVTKEEVKPVKRTGRVTTAKSRRRKTNPVSETESEEEVEPEASEAEPSEVEAIGSDESEDPASPEIKRTRSSKKKR